MITERNRRRQKNINDKPRARSKKQLVIMLISVAVMVFTIVQVYYLAQYTLGREISSEKLSVYRWVNLLINGDQKETDQLTVK